MLYFVYLLFIFIVNSRNVEYNFTITEEVVSPDLTVQKAVLVNNQFPGPEIRAKPKDTVIVNVLNNINSNLTMHFHGLDQKGSNDADGVPYVTQYPIKPNGTYSYKIKIGEQSGTYWYHSHVSFYGVTAFGPLIIEDENWKQLTDYDSQYSYDKEIIIVMSDLFHKTNEELENATVGEVFSPPDNIASILTNGQTLSLPDNTQNTTQELPITTNKFNYGNMIFDVKKGSTYRLRFIGATNVGLLNCRIMEHDMTIIEMDGVLSEPIKTERLMLNSGQRYSVLVTFDKEPDNYWGYCQVEERDDPKNGRFLFRYENNKNYNELELKKAPELPSIDSDLEWVYRNLTVSDYYIQQIKKNKGKEFYSDHNFDQNYVYPFPENVDKKIIIDLRAKAFNKSVKYVIQGNVFGESTTMLPMKKELNISNDTFVLNGTTFATPKVPILEKFNKKNYDAFPGVYQIKEGQSIELVIQNYAFDDGTCFEHPWHLHGHPFYVLDYGGGLYDEKKVKINKKNLVFRDTDTVFRNPTTPLQPREACGWKVIRFRANNPGAWIMHCHITYHMMMGMQLVFMELPLQNKNSTKYHFYDDYSKNNDTY